MARPNIQDYSKNMAKTFGYGTKQLIDNKMPTTTSIVKNGSEFYKRTYTMFKEQRSSLLRGTKNLEDNELTSHLHKMKKNALADLRSGDFYNEERSMAAFFDEDSSYDPFADEGGSSYDDGSSDSVVPTTQKSIESVTIANAIGSSSAASTEVLAETITTTNTISNTLSVNHHMEMSNILNDTLRVHQGIFEKLNVVIESNKVRDQYFTDSMAEKRKTNAILDEMVQMQRVVYKETDGKNRRGNDDIKTADIFYGGFDFDTYSKYAKKNLRNTSGGGMAGMLKDMLDNESIVKSVVASPLSFVADALIEKVFPDTTMKLMENLDKTMSGFFGALAVKMTEAGKAKGGKWKNIADIFGINADLQEEIKPGSYNKGPVPWDGMARKSLIEVIPSYLANIEAALTGKQAKFYDYNKSKFNTIDDIYGGFEKRRRDSYASDMFDVRSGMEKNLRKVMSKDAAKAFMEGDYDKFERFLMKSGHFFNPRTDRDYGSLNSKGLNLDGGQDALNLLVSAFANMERGTQLGSNIDLMRARNSSNQFYKNESERLHESGLGTAFNGILSNVKLEKGKIVIDKEAKDLPAPSTLLDDIKTILLNGIIVYNNGSGGIPKFVRKKHAQIGKKHGYNNVTKEIDDQNKLLAKTKGKSIEEIEKQMVDMSNVLQDENQSNFLTSLFGGDNPLARLAGKYSNNPIIQTPLLMINRVLKQLDEGLYHIIYGRNPRGDDDEDGNTKNGGIINHFKKKFNNVTDWIKLKFSKGFLDPIHKKYFDKDEGIITKKLASWKDSFKGAFAEGGLFSEVGISFKNIAGSFTNFFVGKKNKESGKWEVGDSILGHMKGMTSGMVNAMKLEFLGDKESGKKGILTGAWDYVKDSTNKLFGSGEEKGGLKDNPMFKKFSAMLPKSIAGGLMGMLAAPVIPGGLALNMVMGASLAYGSQSDKVKKYLFGDEEEDGMIPKPIVDFTKQHGKGIIAGSLLGGIASAVLPGGALMNMALGGTISFMSRSEGVKNFLFGKKDADGKIIEEGAFPQEMQDWYKKHGKSILTGGGLGLVGSMFLPGGPILGSIMGSAIGFASSTDRFKEMIFGKEGEDGKKQGGLAGILNKSIIDPFKKWSSKTKINVSNWFEDNMSKPFREALTPMREAMGIVGENIKGAFSSVGDRINNMFEDRFGKPFGELVEDKLLAPMRGMLNKVTGLIGKVIGGILTAPLKLVTMVSESIIDRRDKTEARQEFTAKLLGRFRDVFQGEDGGSSSSSKSFFSTLRNTFKKSEKEESEKQSFFSRIKSGARGLGSKINEEASYFGDGMDARMLGAFSLLMGRGSDILGNAKSRGSDIVNSWLNDGIARNTPSGSKSSSTQTSNSPSKGGNKIITLPNGMRVNEADLPGLFDMWGIGGDSETIDENGNKTSSKSIARKGSKGNRESVGPLGMKPSKFSKKFNSMAKNIKDIRDSVHNQLNGVGWNLQYVTNLLTDIHGKPNTIPEDANDKTNKKRRSFFGRMKDKVINFKDSAKEFGLSLFSIPFNKMKDAFGPSFKILTNVITSPLRLIGSIGKGMLSGLDLAVGIGKEVGRLTATVLGELGTTIIQTIGTSLKVGVEALGEGIKSVLNIMTTATGLFKESVLTLGGIVREGLPAIAGIITETVATFGSLLLGVGRAAGNAIGGLFKRGSRRMKEKSAQLVEVVGGKLDHISVIDRVITVEKVLRPIEIVPFGTYTHFGSGGMSSGGGMATTMSSLSSGAKQLLAPTSRRGNPNFAFDLQMFGQKAKPDVFAGMGRKFKDTSDDLQEDQRNTSNNISDLVSGVNNEGSYRKAMLQLSHTQTNILLKMLNSKSGVFKKDADKEDETLIDELMDVATSAGAGLLGAGAGAGLLASLRAFGKSPIGKIATGLSFAVGTYNAFEDGDMQRVGANILRVPGKGAFNRLIASITDNLLDKGATTKVGKALSSGKTALGGKITKLKNLFAKLFDSDKLKRIFKSSKITKNASGEIIDEIAEKAIREGAEDVLTRGITKFVAKFAASIVALIWDFTSGMEDANRLFQISPFENPSPAMKFISGMLNCLEGLTLGIISFDWIAETVLQFVSKPSSIMKLNELQANYEDEYQEFLARTSLTNVTKEEYMQADNKIYDQTQQFSGWTTNKLANSGFIKAGENLSQQQMTQKMEEAIQSGRDGDTLLSTVFGALGDFFKPKKNENGGYIGYNYQRERPTHERSHQNVYTSQYGKGAPLYVNQNTYSSPYGDSTLAEAGCAPAVATMAINSVGRKQTNINEVAKFAVDKGYKLDKDGTTPDFFSAVGGYYGAGFDHLNLTDVDTIMSNLTKGNPIVLMGRKNTMLNSSESSAYPLGAHYILATGLTKDGRVKILDPGNPSNNNKSFDLNRLLTESSNGMRAYRTEIFNPGLMSFNNNSASKLIYDKAMSGKKDPKLAHLEMKDRMFEAQNIVVGKTWEDKKMSMKDKMFDNSVTAMNNNNQIQYTPPMQQQEKRKLSIFDIGGILSGIGGAFSNMLGISSNPANSSLGVNPYINTATGSVIGNAINQNQRYNGTLLTGDTDIHPWFAWRLDQFAKATGQNIKINSGYRSYDEQVAIANSVLKNNKANGYYMGSNGAVYNSQGLMRVAPPGRSRHQVGLAVDTSNAYMKGLSNTQLEKYGIWRSVKGESWHYEPIETKNSSGTKISTAQLEKMYGTPMNPVSGGPIVYGSSQYGMGVAKNVNQKAQELRANLNKMARDQKSAISRPMTQNVVSATAQLAKAKQMMNSGAGVEALYQVLMEVRELLRSIADTNYVIAANVSKKLAEAGGSPNISVLSPPGQAFGQNGFNSTGRAKRFNPDSIIKGELF